MKNRASLSAVTVVLSTMLLSACNKDSASDEQANHTVTGTVSGLEGRVVLNYNDQQLVINESGEFSLPATFVHSTTLTLSLTETPFRQSCQLANELLTVNQNITNLDITCQAQGSLSGTVKNYYDGTPIAGATIRLQTQDMAGQLVDVVTTDESGQFSISGTGTSDRFVVNVAADAYAAFATIYSNETEQDVTLNTVLVRNVDSTVDFDNSTASTVSVNGLAVVELPARSLVKQSGDTPEGMITASVTFVDPSSDPGIMPGNYETNSAQNGVQYIESFGAINITFSDAANNDLQLMDGQLATIRIPLASSVAPANAPETIPLYYFNEETGYWVEEGEAVLSQVNNAYVYVGSVAHFTYWNADRVYESVNITGCVEDGQGGRVTNASVRSQGKTYIGSAEVATDLQGNFSLPARQNAQVLVSAVSGATSNTMVVSTDEEDVALAECLVLSPDAVTIKLSWEQDPEDLDSHFFGPLGDEQGEFHVYFGERTAESNGAVIHLDVDDVDSFGPEIVSISRFATPGSYYYYVHRFSGISDIKSSPARVEVEIDGETTIFNPENASGSVTDNWSVFEIQVGSDLKPTLVATQRFEETLHGNDFNMFSVQRKSSPISKYHQ